MPKQYSHISSPVTIFLASCSTRTRVLSFARRLWREAHRAFTCKWSCTIVVITGAEWPNFLYFSIGGKSIGIKQISNGFRVILLHLVPMSSRYGSFSLTPVAFPRNIAPCSNHLQNFAIFNVRAKLHGYDFSSQQFQTN